MTKLDDFKQLVGAIHRIHDELSIHAMRAVNINLTLRNGLMGCYMDEYELESQDRATYGERLLNTLAESLKALQISHCNHRQLYRYLKFYRTYPQIIRTLFDPFKNLLPDRLLQTLSISPAVGAKLAIPSHKLIQCLSYSMFKWLITIPDALKRTFYEVESIQGNGSSRELERQMGSLYDERSGLSFDKHTLSALTHEDQTAALPSFNIRDPYIFEFLGLKPQEVMKESMLEEQLMDKIQEFLLELGHGFCFEAKQKRILIGDEHFFIDLVFYNRILKCHVLVELKLKKFSQENISQLNTYVNGYKRNMMLKDDNPPVGILLCTDKNHALVEYALAGMDNQLFVSRYLLELPTKEEMQKFIQDQIKKTNFNT